MKKVLLLMFAILAIVSCEYRSKAEIEEVNHLGGFNIIVIDSCEYLIGKQTHLHEGYGYFAHKGNCRFCKERKERKERYENE